MLRIKEGYVPPEFDLTENQWAAILEFQDIDVPIQRGSENWLRCVNETANVKSWCLSLENGPNHKVFFSPEEGHILVFYIGDIPEEVLVELRDAVPNDDDDEDEDEDEDDEDD